MQTRRHHDVCAADLAQVVIDRGRGDRACGCSVASHRVLNQRDDWRIHACLRTDKTDFKAALLQMIGCRGERAQVSLVGGGSVARPGIARDRADNGECSLGARDRNAARVRQMECRVGTDIAFCGEARLPQRVQRTRVAQHAQLRPRQCRRGKSGAQPRQ